MSGTHFTKRIAGGVVALATLLSMGVAGLFASSAVAAPPSPSVTVTAPADGSVEGHTLKTLEIGYYTNVELNTAGDGVTSFALGTNVPAASLNAAVTTANGGTAPTTDGYAADNASAIIEWVARNWYGTDTDDFGNTDTNSTQLRAFARALQSDTAVQGLLDAGTTGADPSTTLNPTLSEGKTGQTLADGTTAIKGGIVLVVDTSAPAGQEQSLPMIVPTGVGVDGAADTVTKLVADKDSSDAKMTLGEINLKAKETTVTKKLVDPTPTYTVGDDVNYSISTQAPSFAAWTAADDWTNAKFKVADIMPDALEFSEAAGDLHVYMGDTAADAEAKTTEVPSSDYALNVPGTGDEDFNVEFSGEKVKTIASKYIYVTFKAQVTKAAVAEADSAKLANTTTVNVPPNPSTDEYPPNPPSDTTPPINLVGFELKKVDSQDGTTVLPGAEFQLTDTDGALMKFDETPVAGVDGKDYFVYAKDQTATTGVIDTLVVPADGILRVTGLPVSAPTTGTTSDVSYTATETKAPTQKAYRNTNEVGAKLNFKVDMGLKWDTTDTVHGAKLSDVTKNFDAGAWSNLVTASPSATGAATPAYAGQALVKNTTSLTEMPRTGGDILVVLAVLVVLVGLGVGSKLIRQRHESKLNEQ
ncbi:MAG: isopeptide-forming domain-containing fimbrial protein [Bifidobacteriaceae bacterium]|jgi:fimbrial isopeptide formation D2 family protein|nr:isopeptide-forming domain-containing fimbrial protein [Bifidobacteriaceae bacterium]MCI1914301.1 isopeptide-forming domain-containing fimbrial protein [Bifidobacteriaceae bacterium]